MSDPRSTTPHLETYYSKRAREYEQIYEKPERQRELAWLRERIPQLYRGRTVLEVACGTGYWTQFIAQTAHRVYAGDINDSVLEIAREKPLAPGKVTFMKADAITLDGVPPGCNAAFAGFWWSHVKKSGLRQRNARPAFQSGAGLSGGSSRSSCRESASRRAARFFQSSVT